MFRQDRDRRAGYRSRRAPAQALPDQNHADVIAIVQSAAADPPVTGGFSVNAFALNTGFQHDGRGLAKRRASFIAGDAWQPDRHFGDLGCTSIADMGDPAIVLDREEVKPDFRPEQNGCCR